MKLTIKKTCGDGWVFGWLLKAYEGTVVVLSYSYYGMTKNEAIAKFKKDLADV